MPEEDVRPGEVIEAVTKRAGLLDLVAEAPHAMRDLRDRLEVSRSTAYKAVRELEAFGIVERTEEGVELTPFGRLVHSQYGRVASDLERMAQFRSRLPRSPLLDPVAFRDAEVVVAEPHAPDRPVDVFEELVRGAGFFRGFSPVARSRYVDLFRECALEGDMRATIITEPGAVEVVLADHPEVVERVAAAGNIHLLQAERSLSFGLSCLGDPTECVIVGLHDERQQLAGLLVTEAPAAITWGEETFRTVEANATALTPPAD